MCTKWIIEKSKNRGKRMQETGSKHMDRWGEGGAGKVIEEFQVLEDAKKIYLHCYQPPFRSSAKFFCVCCSRSSETFTTMPSPSNLLFFVVPLSVEPQTNLLSLAHTHLASSCRAPHNSADGPAVIV